MSIAPTSLKVSATLASLVSNRYEHALPWLPVREGVLQVNLMWGKDLLGPWRDLPGGGATRIVKYDVLGSAGEDLIVNGTWQTSFIDAGAGNDTVILHDGGLTYLQGHLPVATPVRILAGLGDDRVSGSESNDIIDGGAGFDRMMYLWSLAGVTVNLSTGVARGGSAEGDVLTGFEALWGSIHADRLTGTAEGNELVGLGGDDLLIGLAGDDTLTGGPGNDTLDGGAGTDTVQYGGAVAVTVDLNAGRATGGHGTDRIIGVENVSSGLGSDSLTGNALANRLAGGAGNDTINGLGGADIIIGGAGRDVMDGGADTARDVFMFSASTDSSLGAARDMVMNFVSGIDDLDLRGIDANTALQGNQAFAFSGTNAGNFSVWYRDIGADLVVSGDTNGDGIADFQIQIAGIDSLAATDFLL